MNTRELLERYKERRDRATALLLCKALRHTPDDPNLRVVALSVRKHFAQDPEILALVGELLGKPSAPPKADAIFSEGAGFVPPRKESLPVAPLAVTMPNPRDVLEALEVAGIFDRSETPRTWERRPKGTPRRYSRLFAVMAAGVLLLVATAAFVRAKQRQGARQAAALATSAESALDKLDSPSFEGAARDLGIAFDKDPMSTPAATLFLRERILRGLLFDAENTSVSTALARAEACHVSSSDIALGKIVEKALDGDYGASLSLFHAHDAEGRENAHYQLVTGRILERVGDHRAKDRYLRASELRPSLAVATLFLLRWHIVEGELSEARALSGKLSHDLPDDPHVLALVSLFRARTGEAFAETRAELTLPFRAVPALLHALSSIATGNKPVAEASLEKALLGSDLPREATWIGELSLSLGNDALAKKAAAYALALSPVDERARVLSAVEELRTGSLLQAAKFSRGLEGHKDLLELVSYEALQGAPPKHVPAWSAAVLEADRLLDRGDWKGADKHTSAWLVRATVPEKARVMRTARYGGPLPQAGPVLDATDNPRLLLEQILHLLGKKRDLDAYELLSKNREALGALEPWVRVLVLVSLGKLEEAKRAAEVQVPSKDTPFLLKSTALSALAAVRDRARAAPLLRELSEVYPANPDVLHAKKALR